MKLSNIFKKGKTTSKKATVQALAKNQLAKVAGGTEVKAPNSIQDESKGFSSLIR